jgi:hypothetical protein
MLCARIRLISPDLTRADSVKTAAFRAAGFLAIRASSAAPGSLVATNQAWPQADPAAVAVAAAVAAEGAEAALLEAAALVAVEASQEAAVDEMVVADEAVPADAEDVAVRMQPSSAIVPGVPQTRSGPSCFLRRKTQRSTRGRFPLTVKNK